MANGGETSRRALQNKTEEYYRNLRQACKSGSDRRKEEIATLMAERIYEKVVFPLLERLATDTHICKIQAIRTIGKVKNPNEDVLRILLSLLNDHDTKIRYEATRIIVNFIEVDFVYGELAVQMGISVLDLAEKLLSGPHESKMQALEIYKRNWKSNPSRVIQDLEKKLNQEEKDDYIAFKGMMNLFGEIGKCYPKRITRILKDLLFDEEIRDEVYISSILEGIAENHPNEILELLEGVTDNRNIYSKKVIPDLLQFTAEKSPERTFELLKRLATDDHKSIRHRVLESLEHFQNQFPDYTLDVLQRLWQKAEDEIETRKENRDISQDLIPRNVKDMHPMQERIRSRFDEAAQKNPLRALSILQILSTCSSTMKRRDTLEAALKLASSRPREVFSLMKIFSFDPDYEIKNKALSSFTGDWNRFPEDTITLLLRVLEEEIEKLREKIEGVFSSESRKNHEEVTKKLVEIKNGDIRDLIDKISKTALELHRKIERVPEELLLDGTLVVQRELMMYLNETRIETWEDGIEYLNAFSKHHENSMKLVSLKVLQRFLPENLNSVLEILNRFVINENSQVRVEALDFLVSLIEDYPSKSFEIIKTACENQNEDVRIDSTKMLSRFKKSFPEESFQSLEKYAEDPNPNVRAQVASSLIRYSDSFPESSFRIASTLCRDNDDLVINAAFGFLEEFMKINSEKVLELSEDLCAKEHGAALEKVAAFLGNFNGEYSSRVMSMIESLARNPILSVKSSAFSSLDKISKFQPERVLTSLSALLSDKDPEIRCKVITSIGILSQSYPVDLSILRDFLEEGDHSVRVALSLTLGKMGKTDPRQATGIFDALIQSAQNSWVREAIAEAMSDYGKYCPYEALKILSFLSKDTEESVTRMTQASYYDLRQEIENFSFIFRTCFQKSFLNLHKKELAEEIEKIVRKTSWEDTNLYAKEIAHRYELFAKLLRLSTVSKFDAAESLLNDHLTKFRLVDDKTEKSLLALKKIAQLLQKQDNYERRDDKMQNINSSISLLNETKHQFAAEFKEFDNPDSFIFRSILDAWESIISVESVRLAGRADIRTILKSNKAMKRDITIVRLRLRNEGNSKAENIVVSILPSKDFDVVGQDEKRLKILSPHDSDNVEFSIKVKFEPSFMNLVLEGIFSVRVVFRVEFEDAEKEGKIRTFADQIRFYLSEKKYIRITNPYITGIPLRTPEMFYGRDEFLRDIENDLRSENRTHILILHGQRRTGKTSILYQLKLRLKDDFIPIVLDFQGIPDSGTDTFFYWMAKEIYKELYHRNIIVPMPVANEFSQRPAFSFRDIFLHEVKQHIGHRRLVLMLDEFESIDDKISEGKIDRDVLPFMRNLMQHYDNIDFIFSGTHMLEEMGSDYWSILFNIGLYHKISFLERHEAEALIREPVKGCIDYDPLAVEKILEMTAAHPYFVQLACYHVVNHQKKKKRNYVTIEDVNEVLDLIVLTGSAHFEYIWDKMERNERIILLALARLLSIHKLSKPLDIARYLKQSNFEIDEKKVKAILEKLLNEEIIEQKTADHYLFKIELIRLWCEKNKELVRIVEEGFNE